MHARHHSPKYVSPTTQVSDISLLNSISLEQYPYAVLGLETGMHKICQNIKNVSRKQHKPPGKCSRYPDEVVALGPKRAHVTKSATSGPSNFVSMPTEGFYGRMELDLEYEAHSPPAPKTVWVYDNKQLRHSRHWHAQELCWNCTILPQLIYPYMAYHCLHLGSPSATTSSTSTCSQSDCTCHSRSEELLVTCVWVEMLRIVTIIACSCLPAHVQLVSLSLFPCSPMYPQMAISIDMLEFVSELFVNMAPNERAWATMLMQYLAACGHTLQTEVSQPSCSF